MGPTDGLYSPTGLTDRVGDRELLQSCNSWGESLAEPLVSKLFANFFTFLFNSLKLIWICLKSLWTSTSIFWQLRQAQRTTFFLIVIWSISLPIRWAYLRQAEPSQIQQCKKCHGLHTILNNTSRIESEVVTVSIITWFYFDITGTYTPVTVTAIVVEIPVAVVIIVDFLLLLLSLLLQFLFKSLIFRCCGRRNVFVVVVVDL